MRGYMVTTDEIAVGAAHQLQPWELLVVDAVGNIIDFWGFKRNQGRVWALLYLRGQPLSALEIQEALDLSKGAVSMITRELERWGVINRVRIANSASWHFVAEIDFIDMVTRVIRERESGVIARVKADLTEAEAKARAAGDVPPEILDRVVRMKDLAEVVEAAVTLFLSTHRLAIDNVSGILLAARAFAPAPVSTPTPTQGPVSTSGAHLANDKQGVI